MARYLKLILSLIVMSIIAGVIIGLIKGFIGYDPSFGCGYLVGVMFMYLVLKK